MIKLIILWIINEGFCDCYALLHMAFVFVAQPIWLTYDVTYCIEYQVLYISIYVSDNVILRQMKW